MAHSRRAGISYFVAIRSALATRESGTGCGIQASELMSSRLMSPAAMEEACYVRRVIYPLERDLPVLRGVREQHQRASVHRLRVRRLRHGQHVGEDLGAVQAGAVHPEAVLLDLEDDVAVAEPEGRRRGVRSAAKAPPLRGREQGVVGGALPHGWATAVCPGVARTEWRAGRQWESRGRRGCGNASNSRAAEADCL